MLKADQIESRRHYRAAAAFLLVLIFAAHARPFISYEPGDVLLFVTPWYERVATNGFAAFSTPFGNYTPPYLYLLWACSFFEGALPTTILIKLLSVAGAVLLSLSLWRLFRLLKLDFAGVAALASLLLPSMILNVSTLGQADVFWLTPCILALCASIQNRLGRVAFWSGVAFAFKAQAIFLAPFVMHLFITRRARWWCWTIPPLVYAGAMFPAWLAGWPAWDLATIYFRQANWQPENEIFVSNGGSWWTLFGFIAPNVAIKLFPIGYACAVVGTVAYLRMRPSITGKGLVAMATLSAAGLPFLLPGMHDRYFVLADVLAFSLAVVSGTRMAILAAILIQIGSALPVASWAYEIHNAELASPFFILGGIVLLVEMLKQGGDERIDLSDGVVARAAA